MKREEMIARLVDRREPWDIAVIGGGATGVGIALDAATRGYSVVLFEQHDFGKGTSSRSTKLVHGGVRYLEQGNVSLVMEALKERGLLRQNAPHLVHDLAFVVPNYEWWEAPFYGIGLRLYDLLAGKYGFGRSRNLSREETLERIPTLKTEGLRGGVVYFDGQFDDSRLLIHMAMTAAEQGAVLLNYCPVVSLRASADGYLRSAVVRDEESGAEHEIHAKVFVNATGPFTDQVRRFAEPSITPLVAPSQGAHIVLDRSFLKGDGGPESAILVPRTRDGRVMFAIPWHSVVVVGTTDTAIPEPLLEPKPLEEEIDFILETAAEYLQRAPSRADILSTFAGIRPLVNSGAGSTAALSRDHTIHIDPNGLVTITGGKWTTYRKMAEDCVDQAATIGFLDERPSKTRELHLHGWDDRELEGWFAVYGSDAEHVRELGGEILDPRLPHTTGEVQWAARNEMARTVEDILSRRTRALLFNARAALDAAPKVARILAAELGREEQWILDQIAAFEKTARGYIA
jgi:glycerol-3-phosphate dehydrogenase